MTNLTTLEDQLTALESLDPSDPAYLAQVSEAVNELAELERDLGEAMRESESKQRASVLPVHEASIRKMDDLKAHLDRVDDRTTLALDYLFRLAMVRQDLKAVLQATYDEACDRADRYGANPPPAPDNDSPFGIVLGGPAEYLTAAVKSYWEHKGWLPTGRKDTPLTPEMLKARDQVGLRALLPK